MSVAAASNSKKSRPSPSFSSLPDEVVLNCLSRVPRRYDLNLSLFLFGDALRLLVHSPELHRLRSPLNYWISFRPGEKPPTIISVGSEIYFIGGRSVPSMQLWILDTRSGHLKTAPSMKVCRSDVKVAVGVVDRKIHVIGGSKEDSQVEEFDPETQTWDFAGEGKLKCESWFSATLEEKVYMVNWDGRVSTYSPREGINNEETEILSIELDTGFHDPNMVENVLYACFKWNGLMWFNTKFKVWRRVVDRDGKDGKLELNSFAAVKMVEYEGTIAFFWPLRNIDPNKKDLTCKLIALDRVGEEISGRIEWSGTVTLPDNIILKDCLVVSG
ncbi:hypothetical protein BRARA_E02234 [Brassica rapa]|uniref:FKB95-like N-terminal Kelch domain-containing protein n=1 Tax=Brassica campestris TaxID=3711 RepID=A0A397ZC31_BRACM|nr:hypothetical protein BRARA_E02234 [Brassica rapa]